MKKLISLLISMVLLFNVGAEAFAAYTEDRAKAYESGSCKITYTIQNEWDNCRQIQMAITNNGSVTVRNWALKFGCSGEITNIWNAEVCQNDGEIIALRNSGYNYEIIPDGTVEFGFQVRGDDLKLPWSVSLCNKTVDSTDNAEIGYEIQNSWDGGFIAEVSVTNNSDMPLEAWRLSFNGNFEITNLWNANKLYSGNGFLVENNVSTMPIAKGETKTFGFQGSIASGETPEMSDFILTSVVIDLDSEMPVEPDKPIEPAVPDKTNKITCYAQYVSEAYAYEIYWESTATGPVVIYDNTDGAGWCKVDEVDYNSSYFYDLNNDFEEKFVKVTQQIADYTIESKTMIIRNTPYGYLHTWQDSDDDGVSDYYEDIYDTDENSPDTDNDGLTDYEELYITKTNPLVYDSTGNGVGDADDDLDNDGLSNKDEVVLGTSPSSADTDDDGLSDYDELNKYNTDPLKADTDGDTLNDGEEIAIGLDPNDPETFGVPDAEYKVEQTVSADSEAMSEINTSESPYELSLEISATGNAATRLSANESTYSVVTESNARLGGAVELRYLGGDVDKVKLTYKIADEYIPNENSEYAEKSLDFQGIKRYNIFRYFEEINMLLPVATDFDEENNTLSAETDELGTYCILDMSILMRNFDTETSEELKTQTVTKQMYAAASAGKESSSTSSKYRLTFIIDDRDSEIPIKRIENEINKLKKTLETQKSNVDIDIVYQNKIFLFDEYIVITDKLSDIINKANKSYNNYIFELYGDENVIFEQNIAEELCQKAIEKDIRISVFTPFDDKLEGYQRQLVDVTGGMTGNGFDEFTDKNIYEYVFGEKYVAKEYLPVILATGYKKIVLDTLLYPNGENPSAVDSDTDKDGLSDWDEVMTNLLTYDDFGNYTLPTVRECANKLDKVPFYITEALLHDDILNQYWYTRILPIKSDPTSSDGDGDGILDADDEYPLFQQIQFVGLDERDSLIEHEELRKEMEQFYNVQIELDNKRILNQVDYKSYLAMRDEIECCKDVLRADYVLSGYNNIKGSEYSNNEKHKKFNSMCFGDSYDENTMLFNDVINYGVPLSNRIGLIVFQRIMAYNQFYTFETYGKFDVATLDAVNMFASLTSVAAVNSSPRTTSDSGGITSISPEALNAVISNTIKESGGGIHKDIYYFVRLFARYHNAVADKAAKIVIKNGGVSGVTSVDDYAKLREITVRKGGVIGFGFADVLAQYDDESKVWEVKSAFVSTKTGLDQLSRYINASKQFEQKFKTPLVEGYCLEPFTLVLDGKYIIAFNSKFDIIYNKFKYRRDNDMPYDGAFVFNGNDTAGISGDGLIKYLVFSTPERRARFASEVLEYTITENSDDEIPVQSSRQPEVVFSTSSAIDMEVVGQVVLGITVVGVIALIVVTDGAAAPLLAMI